MKFLKKLKRSKLITRLSNYLIRFYIAIIFCTCKFIKKEDSNFKSIIESKQCIFAIWHSRILIFPALDLPKVTAVVSAHGDGGFIADILKIYGHKTARGSSRKDGLRAMRELLKALKEEKRSICITPDGPKGPRYRINGSISGIAAKFNLPIIPMCFSANHAIVLSSWDRFVIPLPFSKIYLEIGAPIYFDSEQKDTDEILANIMFEQMVNLDKIAPLKIDY